MKPKVLFLLTRSDAIGGAAIHVSDISSNLRELGYSVGVLIGGKGPVLSLFRLPDSGIYPVIDLVRELSPAKDFCAFFRIAWRIFILQPDVVSIHTSKVGILGRMACFLLGRRSIYTPHCWSFSQIGRFSWIFKLVEICMTYFSTIIVCVSKDEKSLILKTGLVDPRKFLVIHNGMKDSSNEDVSDKDGDIHFVQIARFEEQKDHVTLINALSHVTKSNFKLHLIGDGPLFPEVKRLCKQLGVSDKVVFYGERRDIGHVLQKGRVYVLSTKWEGLPRSIIEAMRTGMPIVASDVGGISEMVSVGNNGFLVPPGESECLGKSMERFIEDPELILTMGLQSRKIYEDQFAFNRMFNDYTRLYFCFLENEK